MDLENAFPSIDEVQEMLEEIVEEVPQDFFKELNLGIILLPEEKRHPLSPAQLCIMGEYQRSVAGRCIAIYYGSFAALHRYDRREKLRHELKETLLHEFTHHLESLAGEKGLERKDEESLRHFYAQERKG